MQKKYCLKICDRIQIWEYTQVFEKLSILCKGKDIMDNTKWCHFCYINKKHKNSYNLLLKNFKKISKIREELYHSNILTISESKKNLTNKHTYKLDTWLKQELEKSWKKNLIQNISKLKQSDIQP